MANNIYNFDIKQRNRYQHFTLLLIIRFFENGTDTCPIYFEYLI